MDEIERKMNSYLSSHLPKDVKVENLTKVNGVYAANLCYIMKGGRAENRGIVGHIFYNPEENKISHLPTALDEIDMNIANLINQKSGQ